MGYAKKLLLWTMKDKELKKRDVYMVAKLPKPFKRNWVKPFHCDDEQYKSMVKKYSSKTFFDAINVGIPVTDTACRDLVFPSAKLYVA